MEISEDESDTIKENHIHETIYQSATMLQFSAK